MSRLKKILFRFLLVLLVLVAIASLFFVLSGNGHMFKAIASTYLVGETGPTIDDHPKFVNRTLKAAEKPTTWPKAKSYTSLTDYPDWKDIAEAYESAAFLIIHRDSIKVEHYWPGYGPQSQTNSFSMAKSLTSIAIGVALQEGKIKSLDQAVGDFLPEFKEGKKAGVTIRHLLGMNSGIDFGESYGDPFGFMAKAYYGKELYELTTQKQMKHDAGTIWQYQGGNTLLLSFIVEAATGESLSDYFGKQVWQAIGAENDALWTLDRENGRERAYCCFYSNARDFARIGKLYSDSGQWEGKQIVPKAFVEASLAPVNLPKASGKVVDYYGFQWWLLKKDGLDVFYARGIQGQYIIAVPEKDLIVVRLGHKRDPTKGTPYLKDVAAYLQMGLDIANQ